MIQIQLKRVLKKRKRSMYWLAQAVEAHYPTIYRLAEGQVALVKLETLDRICEALDCEVSDILVRAHRKRGRK